MNELWIGAQEMKEGSETWNAIIPAIISQTWYYKYKDTIYLCISNNDCMSMGAFNKWAKEVKVPIFRYNINTDVFQKSKMDLPNSYSTIRSSRLCYFKNRKKSY